MGSETLDYVYTNIQDAFRATPLFPFGKTNHVSLLMKPTYQQLPKQEPTVHVWPDRAESTLQDCFSCIDWDMFTTSATTGSQIDIH